MGIFREIAVIGLLIFWSVNLPAQPWRPADPPPAETPYDKLVRVREFAFGGVGYGGITSPGECAFRSIIGKSNVLQVLSMVLTNGTPEAKLYALCGIRELAPAAFEDAARPLVTSNPKEDLMRGCFFWDERASKVVSRIRVMPKGAYEQINVRRKHS